MFPLFHNNAEYTSVMAAMECGAQPGDGPAVLGLQVLGHLPRAKGVTAFNYLGALLMMLFKQPERPDDADNPVRVAFGAPCPVEICAAVRGALRPVARPRSTA